MSYYQILTCQWELFALKRNQLHETFKCEGLPLFSVMIKVVYGVLIYGIHVLFQPPAHAGTY